MRAVAEQISETAGKYGFTVASCAENIDLNGLGIEHNSCIDKEPIERLIGSKIAVRKDKNQRKECGCAESIDIGSVQHMYSRVQLLLCKYNMDNVRSNHSLYDAKSPLLCSTISPDDKVTKRAVKSLVDDQIGLL